MTLVFLACSLHSGTSTPYVSKTGALVLVVLACAPPAGPGTEGPQELTLTSICQLFAKDLSLISKKDGKRR